MAAPSDKSVFSNQPGNANYAEVALKRLEETPDDTRTTDSELHGGVMDNSKNTAKTYWKAFTEATGSVTPGTTAPTMQLPVAAGKVEPFITLHAVDGIFGTQMSTIAMPGAGTSGTTGPVNQFDVNTLHDA